VYEDNVNSANPQAYKNNNLKVSMTNICSEIALYTDELHSFICCLSSLNLARWDEWKDYKFENGMTLPELSIWFLEGALQEFIDRAKNIKFFENTVRSATKGRAVGLGVLGVLLHNLIEMNKINRAASGNLNLGQYLKLERFSIIISIIVVCVAVIIKHEIQQLEQVGKWLGLAFIAIGYMGQSLLVFTMGKASKVIDNEPKP